jgi:regulator of replication initiation timing
MADRVLAQETSDQVLKCVKDCNLHSVVRETPFSLYITLRKKFVIENNSNNLEPKENDQVQTLEESLISLQTENDALDQENSDIRARYEEMKVINGELNKQLSEAKTELCDWMSSYSSVEKANEET